MTRSASCPCGQLTVRVAGEPLFTTACNCTICQKRTGSAFSWAARFKAEQVTVEGRHSSWERPGDSGRMGRQNFCPVCGATVFTEMDAMPGLIGVMAGAFADPGFPAGPQVVAWCENRQPWVSFPADARLMERQ